MGALEFDTVDDIDAPPFGMEVHRRGSRRERVSLKVISSTPSRLPTST